MGDKNNYESQYLFFVLCRKLKDTENLPATGSVRLSDLGKNNIYMDEWDCEDCTFGICKSCAVL